MQQVTTSSAPLSIVSAENGVVASRSGRRNTVTGWLGVIVVLAAIAGPIVLQHYVSFEPSMMMTFGYVAVLLMGALGSITFFLPVPTLTLVFVGATVLNPVLLAIAAAVGITIGMAGCYALGKAGSNLAERSQPDPGTRLFRATSRVSDWYTRNLTLTSFFVAAIPNPVFDYAGYFAGLTGVSQTRFLAATFAGKTVQSLVVALLGYYAFEQISRIW